MIPITRWDGKVISPGVTGVEAKEVASLGAIPSSGLKEGQRCSVNGTVFEIRSSAPRLSSVPLIAAGTGLYAVPISDFLLTNFGTKVAKGTVTSAPDYATASNRQSQGHDFDNRAGTLLVASLDTVAVPAQGRIIEYSYAGGSAGAEVLRTGILPIGHAEYWAVEYHSDNTRHLWVGGNTTPVINRFTFAAGATSAQLEATISLAAITSDTEPKVWGWDEDHLAVRVTRTDNSVDTVHLCTFASLRAGVFSPVLTFPASQITNLYPMLPTQNVRGLGFTLAGVSGYALTDRTKSAAAWIDAETGHTIAQTSLYYASATTADEIEGVGLWWDSTRAKFATHVSVWRSSGSVYMLSLTEPSATVDTASMGEFGYMVTYNANTYGQASQQGGLSRRRDFPYPLNTSCIYITGEDRSTGSTFDPGNFFIEQYQNNGVRQSSRIRAYNSSEVKWDGPADTSFPEGIRIFFGANATSFQALAGGVRVGGQESIGFTGSWGALRATGNAQRPVGVQAASTSASYPAILSQSSLDLSCFTGEILAFGISDPAGPTSTTWYQMQPASWNSATDNSRSDGTASLRWSVVYSATGTINTSDARLKTAIVPLSDAELAAALDLAREVGTYQWLEVVEQKGDKARRHVGLTVQRAIAVMEAHGLEPFSYGFICYDEWDERPAIVGEFDEVQVPKLEAGNRYSFRMDELLAFIARGHVQRQDDLEARLRALESK